jgi:hypothetical protein
VDGLIGDFRWLYTIIILVIYGFAHIPQTYLLSSRFKVPSTGFAMLTAFNITTSTLF